MKKFSELPEETWVRINPNQLDEWNARVEAVTPELLERLEFSDSSTCFTLKKDEREFVDKKETEELLVGIFEERGISMYDDWNDKNVIDATDEEISALCKTLNELCRKQPNAMIEDEQIDTAELLAMMK